MDWTKIKPKYFLKPLSTLSLIEHGALARILTLTAYLERIPTEKELLSQVPKGCLKTLRATLEDLSTPLPAIVEKVLEDVLRVQHKRDVSRLTTKRYREKNKQNNSKCDTSHDTTDKIREDIYIGNIDIKDIKKSSKKKFIKPSLQEIKDYIQEIGASVSAEAFHNKHEANGWKVGKNPMKDWKATVRYWNSLVNKDKPKKDDDLWNKPHPMTLKK